MASQISDSTQRDFGLYIVNSNNIRIENIQIKGTFNGVIMVYTNATNPMTNITFDGISTPQCSYGIVLNAQGVGQITNLIIQNCKITSGWGFDESKYANMSPDGIRIAGDLNGGVIRNNYFLDTFHASINLYVLTGDDNPNQNIRVYGNYITGPNCSYVRGIGCGAPATITGYCSDIEIFRNIIYDTNVKNQIGGKNIKFHHNIIDTTRENLVSGVYYGNADNEQGLNVRASDTTEVVNVEISNNTIINCYRSGIWFGDTTSYPLDSVTIKNNFSS